MNNFFLLNEAIELTDFDRFKIGLSELNTVQKEAKSEDSFLKHDSIWEMVMVQRLYSLQGEEKALFLFVYQLKDSNNYFHSLDEMNCTFHDEMNAFLGIDFSTLPHIKSEIQVKNIQDLHSTKRHYYLNLHCTGDKNKITKCLSYLYQSYIFEDNAIEDIIYWNQYDPILYSKLHELLTDIQDNPFQGGLGKTEVLKKQGGIASKRLNDEHRITYQLEKDSIRIIRCKKHYG